MTFVKPLLAAGAAVAALTAVPASAQYQYPQYQYQSPYQTQYQQYGYQNGHYVYQNGRYVWQPNSYSYGYPTAQSGYQNGQYVYQNGRYVWQSNPYGYGYRNQARTERASAATQQCNAAVQNKLQTKQGIASTIASVIGVGSNARVLSDTAVNRIEGEKGAMRVTGLATTGNFGSYGIGVYGAAGYSSRADLSFSCDVDRYGRVTRVDVTKL